MMLLCLSLLASCNNDDGPDEPEISFEEQLAIDEGLIDDFLAENNIEAVVDETGLRYVIHEQGEGPFPTIGSDIIVTYEGRYFDGGVFDSSAGSEFQLGSGLIAGWQIGIPKIQPGGSITLYIPSGFAYGTVGRGAIPPNANLIFDINLLGVSN